MNYTKKSFSVGGATSDAYRENYDRTFRSAELQHAHETVEKSATEKPAEDVVAALLLELDDEHAKVERLMQALTYVTQELYEYAPLADSNRILSKVEKVLRGEMETNR